MQCRKEWPFVYKRSFDVLMKRCTKRRNGAAPCGTPGQQKPADPALHHQHPALPQSFSPPFLKSSSLR